MRISKIYIFPQGIKRRSILRYLFISVQVVFQALINYANHVYSVIKWLNFHFEKYIYKAEHEKTFRESFQSENELVYE